MRAWSCLLLVSSQHQLRQESINQLFPPSLAPLMRPALPAIDYQCRASPQVRKKVFAWCSALQELSPSDPSRPFNLFVSNFRKVHLIVFIMFYLSTTFWHITCIIHTSLEKKSGTKASRMRPSGKHQVQVNSMNQGGTMRSPDMNPIPAESRMLQIAAVLGTSLFLFTAAVQADTLVVQPSQLTMSAAKPVVDVLVRNTATEERTIHMDINAWQQVDGRDQLTPSGKLIVHPEKLQLKAGETGRVRVGLRLSGPLWEEQAFQLQLTEVPPIPDIGSGKTYSTDNRLTRRSNVQIFLMPPGTVGPRVSWHVNRSVDGAVKLSASNGGRAHVQLHSASLSGPDGQRIEMQNLSTVILPGGTRSWRLMDDTTGGLWQLTANTSAGSMQAEFELEPGISASMSMSQAE
jgi:P pilus assembly chaperone PapD